MTVVYGISNCDTVKKARLWLLEAGIDFEFADFKKTPPDAAQIETWLRDIPLAVLLNKRGTTWRKLDAAAQEQAEQPAGAVALMAAHPSLIKRPVLEHGGRFYCGFTPETYRQIFA